MNPMTGIHEELWAFPCQHAIKIMGHSKFPLIDIVKEVLTLQETHFIEDNIKSKKSREGKYTSITIQVFFASKDEVERVFSAFSDRKEIVWTL